MSKQPKASKVDAPVAASPALALAPKMNVAFTKEEAALIVGSLITLLFNQAAPEAGKPFAVITVDANRVQPIPQPSK
jgi:hypothetical protein